MTSSEPPEAAPARRPRRAVRRAGTVGSGDAELVSTHPAYRPETSETARPDRPADEVPAPEPVVATRSADDSDVGWGDREGGSNDDRLHQDKPPHW